MPWRRTSARFAQTASIRRSGSRRSDWPLPEGAAALVVEVERSPLVHRSPGGYLSRQGSSARELSPEALRRLFQQRGRSGLLGPDEEIVTGTGLDTLVSALVDRFISSRTKQADETQLAKLGLVRDDDNGVPRATVAGVLLCTERPDAYINGAVIEAVRYSGNVLGRAVQHDAATITGPLDRQIRDAVNFARRNTRVAARKSPGRVGGASIQSARRVRGRGQCCRASRLLDRRREDSPVPLRRQAGAVLTGHASQHAADRSHAPTSGHSQRNPRLPSAHARGRRRSWRRRPTVLFGATCGEGVRRSSAKRRGR